MIRSRFDDTQLSLLLDELWRRPQEKAILVKQLVASLNDIDWLILAAWDTAATFGPPSGNVNLIRPQNIQIMDGWRKLFLEVALTDVYENDNQPYLIRYIGVSRFVIVKASSPNIPGLSASSLIHDPKNLLIAMQLIRDHIDSALLKPPDLRNAQIALFATSAKLDEDSFRRLASWFSAIEVYI